MDFQKIIPAFFDVEDKGVALVPSEFVSLATPQSPGPKEQLTDAGTQRDRVRGELCQVSYECLCPNKSDTVWTRLKLGKGTSRLVPLKVGIHGQPYKGVDQHPSPREDGGTALTRSVLATAGFVVVCELYCSGQNCSWKRTFFCAQTPVSLRLQFPSGELFSFLHGFLLQLHP